MSKNVLLLDCGGTQDLAISRSLSKKGYNVFGLFYSKLTYGYYYKYYTLTNIITEKKYSAKIDLICNHIKEHSIDVVIPMSDDSAELVSIYRDRLYAITNIVAPEHSIFLLGYNKSSLMTICRIVGVPHPFTVDLESSKGSLPPNMPFPAIIKPNITNGSRGMKIVNNLAEFKAFYPSIRSKYGECHIQKFIKNGGRQIKAQLYIDTEGNLLHSSVLEKVRFYPVNAGSSSCNISIVNNDVIEQCYKVLKELKWIGFADFDLIEDADDNLIKIMEINPRVPACLKSAIVSGIDWGEILVDCALDNPIKHYDYKPGIVLRHLGFEILWFKESPKRFKTKPNWFHFFGKKIYYQDLDISCIRSFITGTYGNIKSLSSPQFMDDKKH